MIKILFVCHGNICRSPMAEFVMKDLVKKAGLEGQFEIASAATSAEEIGNPVYPPARRKLAEHGISCSGHAARQLNAADYGRWDLFLGMDSANLRNMRRLFGGDPDGKVKALLSYIGEDRDISDPWYSGDFEATWRDVYAGCSALLAALTEEKLPKLVVVLGTTACGKSGLGVELAKRFGGEIVSADSRQVYTGLDLGTGKVTQEEMDGVPHHMLDVVAPNQPYSVADFQAGAYAAIDDIIARGKVPFLVGGSGLYVRAVTEGFAFTDATPDPALRAELEGKTAAELYAILREKTGVTLANGEENNHQRLVRSVEKALADGWEAPQAQPRYRCLLLGVNFPRDKVCQRIDDRLQTRIDAGMIEEVAGLREAGATDEFLEGLGLEYRYILRYLKGEIPSLEALKDELGRAIKRFAKRQVQWFNRDRDVLWLDMEGDFLTQAVRTVEQFLKEP